jgi:putative zinc finger protein
MTEPVAMTTCPTEETLAAFIDGRLADDARKEVIEHMANCGACRDIVLAVDEFQAIESSGGGSVSQFSPRTWFSAAAALAAAAVLFVVFGPMLKERFFPPSAIEQLVEVSEDLKSRPLAGRLSGEFAHRKAYSPARSKELPKDIPEMMVDFVAESLAEKAAAKPTPANLHALGVAQLYQHHYDEGLASLTAAILTETGEKEIRSAIGKSRDAKLLTDLSAALQYKVGDETINAANAQLALEAANAAWKLDKSEETAWNRAGAIERTASSPSAIAAWNEYLKLDSTSEWATEAREKIETLNAPQEF